MRQRIVSLESLLDGWMVSMNGRVETAVWNEMLVIS
jgi:hypothetical protein